MQHRPIINRPQLFVIGAAPLKVTSGLPGANDEVRMYAERIRSAWDAFWDLDFQPWAEENGYDISKPTDATTNVMGAVLGSNKAHADLINKVLLDRRNFNIAYKQVYATTFVTGPSASAMWQTLYTHEVKLKEDRKLYGKFGYFDSPDPGNLESQGGISQNPLDGTNKAIDDAAKSLDKTAAGFGDTMKTVALIGVAGLIGYALLKK